MPVDLAEHGGDMRKMPPASPTRLLSATTRSWRSSKKTRSGTNRADPRAVEQGSGQHEEMQSFKRAIADRAATESETR
jgi:hypothetical protein